MKEYTVTAPFIQINPGAVLSLSEKQAKKRKFALEKIENGVYEVINPFHLKKGEGFGCEELLDKRFAHSIEEEKPAVEESQEAEEEKPDDNAEQEKPKRRGRKSKQ